MAEMSHHHIVTQLCLIYQIQQPNIVCNSLRSHSDDNSFRSHSGDQLVSDLIFTMLVYIKWHI